MKQVKNNLPNKMDNLNKSDIKNKLKTVGIIVVASAAGFICYKLGYTKASTDCGYGLVCFLDDHPEVKEPFVKALIDNGSNSTIK